MTDTEKIALIKSMVQDFWEYHDNETCEVGALSFVTVLYSVATFGEEAQ